MESALQQKIDKRKDGLAQHLIKDMRSIANLCAPVWKQADLLDSVLQSSLPIIPRCKLLYAVECHGVQISSNVRADGTMNILSRGQNLANRPYMLNKKTYETFSLSPVYISQSDRKPSITAMHHVYDTAGNTLGCIAADFDIDVFPDHICTSGDCDCDCELKSTDWRQIKGDPAIRQTLFSQKRVTSPMDQHLQQVHDIINHLICKRGIFHAKLHYSSSRATLWTYSSPYEYRLHVLDEIIDPDVCLAYPKHPYPERAIVHQDKVSEVLARFSELRNVDETLYLRSGSLNVMNGMVGLNFSCDGSHYMSVSEFLDKPDTFWFGN